MANAGITVDEIDLAYLTVSSNRIKKFYNAWQNPEFGEESFAKMDAMICSIGTDSNINNKSTVLLTWVFGYPFSDLIMVLTDKAVYLLASQETVDHIGLMSWDKDSVPSIQMLVWDKNGGNEANFQKFIEAIEKSKNGKTVGHLSEDNTPGPIVEAWSLALAKKDFEKVDVSSAFSHLIARKDELEQKIIRKASQATVDVYNKYLKNEILQIVDLEKRVQHNTIAERLKNAAKDLQYVPNIDIFHLELKELCYPPIIQSGGNYSLNFSTLSDNQILHFGSIVCAFGICYRYYCSNMVRTLLVNPTDTVKETYSLLVELEEHLLQKLQAGVKLSEVYEAGVSFVRKAKPDILDNLTKNWGCGMGIEFQESSLVIGPNSKVVAQKGMVFNLNVGANNLPNPEATDLKGKTYALFIGDTVLVNEGAPASNMTNSKKKINHIGIFFKERQT